MAPLRLDLGGLHEEYVVGPAPEPLAGRALVVAVAAVAAWTVVAAVVGLGVLDAHPLHLVSPVVLPVVAVALQTRATEDRRPRTRLAPHELAVRLAPARTERVSWRKVYGVTVDPGRGRHPGEAWLADGRRLPLVGMPRRDVEVLAQRLEEGRAEVATDG